MIRLGGGTETVYGVQGRITFELSQFLAVRITFELGLGLG